VLQKNESSTYCTDSLDCEYGLLHTAIGNGQLAYNQYFDSLTHSLAAKMINYWLTNAVDTLILCYQDQKYQYTLYYYDRAGNLERTVPPSGVNLITASAAAIKADRVSNTNSSTTKANDTKLSIYKYNAQNQLVYQQTPDGGVSKFYYDAAGRMIFSQNSRQSATGLYSYILYDEQSRPIETGEGAFTSTFVQAADGKPTNAWTDTEYYAACNCTFANVVRSYARNDVVVTVYDTAKVNLGAVTMAALDTQQNLRKRVAAISYYNTLNGLSYTAQKAYRPTPIFTTHYSYDIAGNVNTVVYDYPYLGDVHQQYKRVDYDFDLLSGKVNMISYNRGHKDQFYQRYDYDADNRIINVCTSGDGVIWNKDARYSYYPHGPLATLKIGDNLLQSIEYAYTIQGWLKAMNSDVLRPDKEMGGNGQPGDLTYARDAVAHALHYFNSDYSPIDTTARVTNLPEPAKSLYNGNIVQQNTAIGGLQDMQRTYRYDQLQRLKLVGNAMVSESDLSVTPTQMYKSSYAYDPDGNLTKLTRYDGSGTTGSLFDSLVYAYPTGNANNRLQNVQNYASSASTLTPGQATNNYQYDSTGQLVADKAGHIKIQWTPYGKVRQVLDTITNNPINFTYDGNGNRVFKDIVHKVSSQIEEHKGEYYVHDATGNILAVYHMHNFYAPIVFVPVLNGGIVAAGGTSALASMLSTTVSAATSFPTAFVTMAASNTPTWATAQTTAKPTSFYTTADPALYHGLLTASNGYVNNLRAYTPSGSGLVAGQVIAQAIYNDFQAIGPAMIKPILVLPGLDTVHPEAIALLTHFCSTMPPASVSALCGVYGLTASPDSVVNALALDSAMLSVGNASGIVNQMVTEVNNNVADTVAEGSNAMGLLMNTVNDNVIFNSPSLRSATATPSTFESVLGSAVYTSADRHTMNAFVDQDAPSSTWLGANTTLARRTTMVYNDDPYTVTNDFLTNVGEANIDTIIAALPEVTTTSYRTMVDAFVAVHPTVSYPPPPSLALGETIDTLTLAEHHIYGSSRLGVQRYDTVGYRNAYNTNTTVAQIHNLTDSVAWYSYLFGDLIAKGNRDPYSHMDVTTFAVGRVVSRRFYELTDHLGSIVATVLDRKTGHLPTTSSTSYDYWKPDIATAVDLYPYGMIMNGRSLQAGDTSNYRYGYNNQVKDDEVYGKGNLNSALFWEYDTRLARRWNVDPKPTIGISPYAAFSGNPILFSDVLGDKDKKIEKPKVIGHTKAVITKLSDKEIIEQLDAHNVSMRTNLSNAYLANLVSVEKVSLEMYDKDGNKDHGGMTTVAIGHVVHSGAIGNTQYDPKALEKEKSYSAGVSLSTAFELLANDEVDRTKVVKNVMKISGVDNVDKNVFTVFTDIYFNAGTSSLYNAVSLYKADGKEGVIGGLNSGAIKNPSLDRKNWRIDLLNSTDNNSTVSSGTSNPDKSISKGKNNSTDK
jgi:YD repeat-containing protein